MDGSGHGGGTPLEVSVPARPFVSPARRLFRSFVLGSAVGMVVMTTLVGVGVHRIYRRYIMRHAEQGSVQVGAAILEQERAVLTGTGRDGRATLAVSPEAVPGLDARLRHLLGPFGIVKIKVFSRDSVVVYSTDRAIVDQFDGGNAKLARALRGEVVTEAGTKARMWDLAGERRFDIDLVETYVPVRDGIEIIGSFETYTDTTWSRGEVRRVLVLSMVVVAAVQVAVFLLLAILMRRLTTRLAAAQERLQKMAVTDELTGLANRRHVMSRAEEEAAKIARHRQQGGLKNGVGFVMADIDHFKRINDTYGHEVGDEVLREVACRLRASTRVYDVVGRYGGEEFLVVLPHVDHQEALRVAERIWTHVREASFHACGVPAQVTMSLGVSCVTQGDESVTAAIRRADERLYQAKAGGRDRIVAQ